MEILQRAEARGLDVISFTDHNTVAGYRRMREEINQLEMLEKLKRLMPEEQTRLGEYRRLLAKILVLPGFEFTATFGFHILCIFPPEKQVRELEHLLLDLNIPPDQIDDGSPTVGATTDVLSVYRTVAESGGLVIAAHANSSNGVAMRGFPIGGQTRVAYTQDEHLHALEVTDLEQAGKRSMAGFFNGTKPEYPRRMHCIQGSDAHRLITDPLRKKNLGVGERATDVLVSEVSFAALVEIFHSNDFARTRPHRHKELPAYDFIQTAREEGANIIQAFHEGMAARGGKRYEIIADICAFANANGGTLYIGLNADRKKPVLGVQDPEQGIAQLEKEINSRISPPLQCSLDVHDLAGKKIIRILVPRGDDPPYALDDNKVYVRSEAETGLAVRDEIVELVIRGSSLGQKETEVKKPVKTAPAPSMEPAPHLPAETENPPRTGVEVVSVEERSGTRYFTLRDLRNGNVVKNVTKTSARRLWHYAISAYLQLPADISSVAIQWQRDIGLLGTQKQGSSVRYDMVQRTAGGYRWYFGVTDDGIHGPWRALVGQEDEA